ncbi:MAG: 1-(5-phosphoribosyl)-5-[(5-phosphoribosylamino)methylideneamino]imidazole-4-carboxamide isomerase [Candidatus Bathyarchaeia archaeon]
MLIIPAVDIMSGECVRLKRGAPSTKKVYSKNPLDMVKTFEKAGAPLIHVVDLDAALGTGENLEIIEEILEKARAGIQVAGGIRSLERAYRLVKKGASRIVLGTIAIKDPKLTGDVVERCGASRVAVAADVYEGRVMIEGWKSESGLSIEDFSRRLGGMRCGSLIFTSVYADGAMSGPDLLVAKSLRQNWTKTLIVGGGVRGMDDLRSLEILGVDGAIVGKAIYEGKIDLREAIGEFTDC